MPLRLEVLRNRVDLSRVALLKNGSCPVLLDSHTGYMVTVELGTGHRHLFSKVIS